MFITESLKNKILDTTASMGSLKLALHNMGIKYSDYLQIIQADPNFEEKTKDAQDFYTDNLSRVIHQLAQQRLYEVLNGQNIQKTVKREYIYDEKGIVIGSKYKEDKKYPGVPIQAIQLGLSQAMELEKAVEILVANNALPEAKLEKVQLAVVEYQNRLTEAVNGTTSEKTLTDEMIATIQQVVIGG
ncbi:hypothetical protein HC928_02875 [bacterium]|nr:hypothetical protein [bacterium]